jgi:ABC-2 type transport system permease protein
MLSSEWLLVRRDRALWISLTLLLVLCAVSLWNGFAWLREQRQAGERAAASEAAEYRDRKAQVIAWQTSPPRLDPVLLNLLDPRTPYGVGQAGRIAQLPLPALAATCAGQLDLLPLRQAVSIRTRMRTVADKDGLENPLNLLSGRFDLAFVVVSFLPLVVIAGGYNLISLEREQGTLALLRSQPINPWRVFLTKIVLRGLVLVGGATLFGVTILVLGGGWREPARLGLWAAITLTYGALWWSLAFWINTRRYGSTVNAVALVACWLVFVAIVPSALQIAVAALRPAPSRIELLTAIRDRSIDQRRDGKSLAQAWYAEHPELLPVGAASGYDMAITGTMTHIEEDRRTLPLERDFERQVLSQQDLVSSLRFLSPAIVAYEALQDVAGTGIYRHRHFREQVQTFRETWLSWFHPRIFQRLALEPADYDAMPVFSYSEQPVMDWIPRVLSSVAGLLVASGALLLVSARGKIDQ